MALSSLTKRQEDLLHYIEMILGSEHRMPSYREMAIALKLSAVGSVQDLVTGLLEKEYLTKNGRHLSLAENRQAPVVHVPIVGVVAAGTLTEAIENNLGVLPFSSELVSTRRGQSVFALQVQGQSMIEAGIFEGDIVVVQTQNEFNSGDTIVARHDGEATVKEIYFKGKEVVLHPRNSTMTDIVFDAKDSAGLEILGKVIAVQRKL